MANRKQFLNMDILVDIIEEMRRERKVLMSIQDANLVTKYV